LQALTAKEAAAAHGDADRFGQMIEGLARALGFTVAIAARGDPKTIDTMIEGATAYAHGEAVEKATFAKFMSQPGVRP
jgi:hypothetical protein